MDYGAIDVTRDRCSEKAYQPDLYKTVGICKNNGDVLKFAGDAMPVLFPVAAGDEGGLKSSRVKAN